jgi:hypothetical protein
MNKSDNTHLKHDVGKTFQSVLVRYVQIQKNQSLKKCDDEIDKEKFNVLLTSLNGIEFNFKLVARGGI